MRLELLNSKAQAIKKKIGELDQELRDIQEQINKENVAQLRENYVGKCFRRKTSDIEDAPFFNEKITEYFRVKNVEIISFDIRSIGDYVIFYQDTYRGVVRSKYEVKSNIVYSMPTIAEDFQEISQEEFAAEIKQHQKQIDEILFDVKGCCGEN